MFEWNPAYSVGIGSIDAQHQNLFAIARELHAAMSAGQGKTALTRTLDRLVQYTGAHFAHEERLMRLHDYPEREKHAAEHKALTQQVLKFQEEVITGRAVVTVQVLHFLRDWLQHHIKESDFRYVPHFQARKVV
jgi:hemerythrin-like metal-binding protein